MKDNKTPFQESVRHINNLLLLFKKSELVYFDKEDLERIGKATSFITYYENEEYKKPLN